MWYAVKRNSVKQRIKDTADRLRTYLTIPPLLQKLLWNYFAQGNVQNLESGWDLIQTRARFLAFLQTTGIS